VEFCGTAEKKKNSNWKKGVDKRGFIWRQGRTMQPRPREFTVLPISLPRAGITAVCHGT
jgi:hypothetical protein